MIEHTSADCLVAVWPHIDRAQHFLWRFRGTDHELAGAIDDVYEAMDSATGRIMDAFPEANVLVVSDHGAGPLHGDVNLGGWLTRNGYATRTNKTDASVAALAWKLPPSVRRFAKEACARAGTQDLLRDLGGSTGVV